MSRVFVGLVVAGLCVCTAKPSFAIKPISDVFVATYADDKGSPELKKAVGEAKCNVCHIADKANKKEFRNPYGVALKEALKEAKFDVAEFKKAANAKDEKIVAMVKAAMKKVEEQKPKDAAKDAKTFGARIKGGMLPGGDKDGK